MSSFDNLENATPPVTGTSPEDTVAEWQTGPSPTRSAGRRYRPVCHQADQVKDENAQLLYGCEPGNALPIKIVDQSANDRHTATWRKGLLALSSRQTIPVCKPLRAPKPENRQKRRPLPPLRRLRRTLPHKGRIGRLRRTLPPAVQLSNRHGALHDVVERAFWGTGGQMGHPPGRNPASYAA